MIENVSYCFHWECRERGTLKAGKLTVQANQGGNRVACSEYVSTKVTAQPTVSAFFLWKVFSLPTRSNRGSSQCVSTLKHSAKYPFSKNNCSHNIDWGLWISFLMGRMRCLQWELFCCCFILSVLLYFWTGLWAPIKLYYLSYSEFIFTARNNDALLWPAQGSCSQSVSVNWKGIPRHRSYTSDGLLVRSLQWPPPGSQHTPVKEAQTAAFHLQMHSPAWLCHIAVQGKQPLKHVILYIMDQLE